MTPIQSSLRLLSERIGRALRETHEGPIAYPEAVDLLGLLEDTLSDLANHITETETTPITLICAWCDLVLRDGTLPASHGICPTCQQRVFEKRTA